MTRTLKEICKLMGLVGLLFVVGQSQSVGDPTRPITDIRVVPNEGDLTGRLFVKVRGKEKFVAGQVIDAWIIRGGRQVVYSGLDGSGGFENEGQSLRVYDEPTRTRRKILSEYFGINEVKSHNFLKQDCIAW